MKNSLVFISHAAEDRFYAEKLAKYIECTMHGVKTFVASDPASIPSGGNWFREILDNLSNADALVVIYSRNARNRMWVGFEVGHFWRKHDGKKIHCVYDPQVDLPSPLNARQAKVLTDVASTAIFFRGLACDLGRNYDVDEYGITGLVDAAPKYDEFAKWKSLLKNGQWSNGEPSDGHCNKTVWFSVEEPSYLIENEYEVVRKDFSEPWTKGFSDPDACTCWVNLKVFGVTQTQELFVYLDGGRYFVPMPEQRVSENRDGSLERRFYYDRTTLKYLLGNVIGRYYPTFASNLVEFAAWKGIEII